MLGIYSDCLKVLEKQVVYFQALKQSGAGAAARRSNLRSGLGSMFFGGCPKRKLQTVDSGAIMGCQTRKLPSWLLPHSR